MTIPMILLTLVLNGAEVSMSEPIVSAIDPDGTRQVMVPLRETFEAAGFVVQYHEGEERYVEITGDVDRLGTRRHLLRQGIIHPGRAEVRAAEHVAALPLPVERLEGTLYAPAILLRIIAGGDLRVDLDARELRWDLHEPDDPPLLQIGQLLSDLPAWLHRRVRIEGVFHGTDAPAGIDNMNAGSPAPGAWTVSDGTGAIYCTDAFWIGRLVINEPEAMIGQAITVEGIVRPGWGGLPYLSGAELIVSAEE